MKDGGEEERPDDLRTRGQVFQSSGLLHVCLLVP